MGVSILILTLNEERNLPDCLMSVAWADEVVVLDSFSTDRTLEIAKAHGARLFQRKFDDWSSHQNYAVENIRFRHPWVLYVDADERVTPELRAEVLKIAADTGEPRIAYYVSRRNFFLGKWIKHAMPPGSLLRFFKPGFVKFERLVNPTPILKGPHGYLTSYLDHFNFSKGISEWLEKHNRYSSLEAIEGMRVIRTPIKVKGLFDADRALRRKALKALSFRLPWRPVLKFLYLYIGKAGFLDGRAGFVYCLLQAMYEFMIVVKMMELRRRDAGLPV